MEMEEKHEYQSSTALNATCQLGNYTQTSPWYHLLRHWQ